VCSPFQSYTLKRKTVELLRLKGLRWKARHTCNPGKSSVVAAVAVAVGDERAELRHVSEEVNMMVDDRSREHPTLYAVK
jgi:hypothetical protein